MDDKRRYVYVLNDPVDNKPRYVGMTRFPKKLQTLHPSKWCYSRGNPEKNQWIRDLIARGLKPVFNLWEDTTVGRVAKYQKIWINFLKDKGAQLFNRDKSQACREAALEVWKHEDFRERVKAGRKKQREAQIALAQEMLRSIPALDPQKADDITASNMSAQKKVYQISEFKRIQYGISRKCSRLFKKNLPLPLTAFKGFK
jgi:hypothetical protein